MTKKFVQKLTEIKKSITQNTIQKFNPHHPSSYFNRFKKLKEAFERNPHNQFITLLNAVGGSENVLDGTILYFYKHRNDVWFRLFFREPELYSLVKEEIEWHQNKFPNIKLTLTPRGVMIFDNYQKDNFNILLLTVHNGTWVEKYVQDKMKWPPSRRYLEEDVETNKIFSKLVFKYGGVWIENKQSRFMCDFNRVQERSIYDDKSEKWIKKLWKEPLSKSIKKKIQKSYNQFYMTLSQLVEAYNFNLIFDAHSMRHKPGRPDVSFGIGCSPEFYIPVVLQMKKNLSKKLCRNVAINNPYSGGHILRWLADKYPGRFILSMEINKKIYMNKRHSQPSKKKIREISSVMSELFDFGYLIPRKILFRGRNQ